MDPSPSFPFRVDERPRPQAAESVQKAAFRGAITGADAFPATRAAVRLDGELLRLGNRFVRWPKYREIAFIAAGNAAASQALAVNESLGERLTQGLVAGPDSLPPEVPFRSVRVPRGYPGSREGEEAGRLALELAQGLSEGDLLLLLLSPGAWTSLVAPPAGLAGAEFGRWLAELARRSSNSRLALLAAAAVGDGGSDGRLSEAPRGAEVVPIVVDRGDGAAVTGGSPARRLTDGERAEALAGAEAIDLLGPLPDGARRRLAPNGGPNRALPRSVGRPVVAVAPADALRGAADAVGERRHVARLAQLGFAGGPAQVARAFVARLDAIVQEASGLLGSKEKEGLVAFGSSTLGVPEGIDEGPAIAEFLREAIGRSRRRGTSIGAFATSGGDEAATPAGAMGVVGPAPSGPPAARRALAMRRGITDVGVLLVAVVPAVRS